MAWMSEAERVPSTTDSRNLEVVKEYMELFRRGTFDLPLDGVDPGVTVDWSESHAPYARIYEGHSGWRALFKEIRNAFEEAEHDVHEYVVTGPYVAMHNTAHMRGRDGIAVDATSTIVWTFRDHKIVSLRLFQEHADALKAIGAD